MATCTICKKDAPYLITMHEMTKDGCKQTTKDVCFDCYENDESVYTSGLAADVETGDISKEKATALLNIWKKNHLPEDK